MMNLVDFLSRASRELGISTLLLSGGDVYLLLLTRFIRMFAYGSSTLILAIYFAALGHSETKIGLFMSLTLVGDVAISLALTFVADALGRRRILILGSVMMALSGICFATVSNYWILLLAAVVGVISPSGNEIGPFRAVEESTLAQLSEAATRSDVFAWYVVIGTLGTAGGSLTCGWVTQVLQNSGWSEINSFRFIFWVYAIIGGLKAGISLLLSHRCEVQLEAIPLTDQTGQPHRQSEENEPFLGNAESSAARASSPKKTSVFARISRRSRTTLLKLCGLFFFDSLASGMVPNSLVAFFMKRKFGMPEGQLGSIISAAQFMSSIGNIFASSVAKRIGLVKAMVYTHLPSAIFLALLPLPSSLTLTIILLVARASLASMDQAPRSAFLSAVVKSEERTATMGIVNTVKTMSQSSGPLITGALAGSGSFGVAFVIAGGLKAGYDLGMLKMFVNTKLEGDESRDTIAVPKDTSRRCESVSTNEEDEMELDNVEPASVDAAVNK